MKKFLIVTLSAFLLFAWTPVFAGSGEAATLIVIAGAKKKHQQQVQRNKRQQQQKKYYNHRNNQRRQSPDTRRFYRYNKLYNYQGHYKWNRWHRERHLPKYRYGQYHHDENGFLRFSYCDRGMCFSISID